MLPLPKGLGNRVVSVRRETVSFRIKFKIYQTTLISVLIKIIQSNKYFEKNLFRCLQTRVIYAHLLLNFYKEIKTQFVCACLLRRLLAVYRILCLILTTDFRLIELNSTKFVCSFHWKNATRTF